MLHYKTMSELKQMNKDAGLFYFEPDTMRFFDSRVYSNVYTGVTGWYFVTSERFDHKSPRLFSVRKMSADGSVKTIGEFQQYKTLKQALAQAKSLAEAERGNA